MHAPLLLNSGAMLLIGKSSREAGKLMLLLQTCGTAAKIDG